MGEYLRPMRRKIGVLTLFLAGSCIFLCIRSSRITDQLEIPIGASRHYFTSSQGYFRWTRHTVGAGAGTPAWHTVVSGSPGEPLDSGGADWIWRLDFYTIELGQGSISYSPMGVWTFSYLNGIPLTCISVALLLLSPRKSTQRKLIESEPCLRAEIDVESLKSQAET